MSLNGKKNKRYKERKGKEKEEKKKKEERKLGWKLFLVVNVHDYLSLNGWPAHSHMSSRKPWYKD